MDREDWIRKLTSRKFWLAVAGFVSGLIVAFGGTSETAETVSGLILAGASVLGYLLAEGLSDVAGAQLPEQINVTMTGPDKPEE